MNVLIKFMLPKAENLLRVANNNIIGNLLRKHEAHVVVPPLIERAYIITNETGTIPYRDYPEDVELEVQQ